MKRPRSQKSEEEEKRERRKRFSEFKKNFILPEMEEKKDGMDVDQNVQNDDESITNNNNEKKNSNFYIPEKRVKDETIDRDKLFKVPLKTERLKPSQLFEDEYSDEKMAESLRMMDEEDELDKMMREINEKAKTLSEESIEKAQKSIKIKVHIENEKIPQPQPEPSDPKGATVKILKTVDHSKIDYRAFEKNLYIEVPELKKMKKQEVRDYRVELDKMKIRGRGDTTETVCPKPIKAFTQCGLNDRVEAVMKKNEYLYPTPIQAQAIPTIMTGMDVIGIAKTGSGKTLAFVLPLIRHLLAQEPRKGMEGPAALILAPARELAQQIHLEIKKFKKATKLTSVCVYGGAHVQTQIGSIKRGVDIVN
jgi:ATP-dependent RNA helicase DDX46/PRP5